MKKTIKTLLVAALLLATASCSDDPELIPALSVDITSIESPAKGGSYTLGVTSNSAWTVTSSATWCTVSPASGDGDGTFTITVAANYGTPPRPRAATITIQGKGATEEAVVISQDPKGTPVLKLDKTKIAATANDSMYSIAVTSNSVWTATSDTSWCTVSPASSDGDGMLTIAVAVNNTATVRTATLTIQTDDAEAKTVTVTVTQVSSLWTLVKGTLTISKECPIDDYEYDGTPWFAQRESITSVIISESITRIGNNAFNSCSNLVTVIIPESVTSIGDKAFIGCYKLTAVTIPESVTSIGDYAFSGCNKLTTVTIPASVTILGERAFGDCYGLTAINVDAGNPNYASDDGVLFNKDKTTLILSPGAKSGNYTIPNTVTSIEERAFYPSQITAVTIPASVESIGESAFVSCLNLTAINVDAGNSNYSSDGGVLFNKNKSTLVQYPGAKSGNYTIPNFVTSIGYDAFAYCDNLTAVTIPDSVTGIGGFAFYACTNLAAVYVSWSNPSAITLGYSVFSFIKSDAKLYVPDAALATYKANSKWRAYFSTENIIGE
ncbi:MAG: leucine-rich repeat protein [Prevotellaceae bacterium]|jgi:hypothetical protein|nr:leucine-rich repeat protein [Prevotellaceae bacterium]